MTEREKFNARWLETEPLIGGALCLDFANTVTWRAGSAPIERLTHYQGLLHWLRRNQALSAGSGAALAAPARRAPPAAARVLREAVAFREVLYRIFSAVAHHRRPAVADLADFNGWMKRLSGRVGIVAADGRYTWGWTGEAGDLRQVLWPIAQSAAQLLTSEDLSRVRECDGQDCGWLFVDRSRNHLRRWCSMMDCGNRAKVREHYRKSRAAES